MTNLLVYTPTYDDALCAQTVESLISQRFDGRVTWEIGRQQLYPVPNNANVVAQYQRARLLCLAGEYDALLTVEHDMILPPDAFTKLYATDALVVYGVYLLRHGIPTLNAWQKKGDRNIGMSLSLYPRELKQAQARGWAEVSGTGWGCTLIRREVLERIEIYSTSGDAGDIQFAVNCLHNRIRQIARFDVPCQHIDLERGRVLDISGSDGGRVARVLARTDVIARVGSDSIPLRKGRYYTMPVSDAHELMRAGYVEIRNDDVPEEGTETAIAPMDRETAVAPQTRRKPKGKAK